MVDSQRHYCYSLASIQTRPLPFSDFPHLFPLYFVRIRGVIVAAYVNNTL